MSVTRGWKCAGCGQEMVTVTTEYDCGEPGDLVEVSKIACELIRSNPNEAMIDVADMAWTLWRAIKAGQEERKP